MRRARPSDVVFQHTLPHSVYDSEGHLLLEAGELVSSEHMRDALLERGFVADEKSVGGKRYAPVRSEEITTGQGLSLSMARSRNPSVDVLALRDQLHSLLQRLLRPDSAGLADAIRSLRDRLIELIEHDDDAVMGAIQISTIEDSATARPMHAGMLSYQIGKAIGLDDATLRALTGAGLTYDVALAPLAATLNHQTSAPTPEQKRLILEHPLRGMEALMRAGVAESTWLNAVLHHHERLDGSGYPSRQSGDEVSQGARILGMVDTYCALVRPRAYRGAVSLSEALRVLFMERTSKIDADLANLFVTQIGLYPAGTVVRLQSQEIAVIYRRGARPDAPRVRVVLNTFGKSDVSRPERDTSQPNFQIVETLQADRYVGLLAGIERIWD
jgi:HD-GYP domain-containing protein (c-di-GMP phosphodiesterase class II)